MAIKLKISTFIDESGEMDFHLWLLDGGVLYNTIPCSLIEFTTDPDDKDKWEILMAHVRNDSDHSVATFCGDVVEKIYRQAVELGFTRLDMPLPRTHPNGIYLKPPSLEDFDKKTNIQAIVYDSRPQLNTQ
ncbi:hypothetical protein IHC92_17435 [Photobacterium damselae subsp. damselae]|uniref:hypothetical protein n=1 Tax=Photobacterium damselae TaxID=38293 RepID=UPI001F3EE2BA|nr:hypothetical protein [Photobacterium damselae]UJZ96362.1 hypothetical protein IHC87_17495 [Photobacterium damselae subsp. damselae]UJZ99733.1 hypothetical protein IHC88_19995 [Photobacterium damselae subsp. damselae]UKA08852.1 hypothetical protein IHC90_17760 [Photobacterium damselae subsp. damselae]UKA23945.1 hypothetical protein IHC92_17435 [Photobacterium damselae subsp. damselae]